MVCEVGTCIYGVVYVSLDTFKKFYYTGAILGIVILLFVYLPMYTLFIQNFSIFVSNLSLSQSFFCKHSRPCTYKACGYVRQHLILVTYFMTWIYLSPHTTSNKNLLCAELWIMYAVRCETIEHTCNKDKGNKLKNLKKISSKRL